MMGWLLATQEQINKRDKLRKEELRISRSDPNYSKSGRQLLNKGIVLNQNGNVDKPNSRFCNSIGQLDQEMWKRNCGTKTNNKKNFY